MVLLAHIRDQYKLSLGSYGRPRMTEGLKELGLNIGHRRIDRINAPEWFKRCQKPKYKATTLSNHRFNIAPTSL